ncbi:hypothetical protein [Streptomyces sp. ISL-11]|uniref:hypothetical protein n=1 Tax=Streptomyces sp. ISL-11 TaxID=2819174 RepID=UPI001BE6BA67|nr:hypothetical protein [Streptomyces sp. ISL-11]MBT2383346.1 hypothetical protein [Streptomyces sp. ISL-11]
MRGVRPLRPKNEATPGGAGTPPGGLHHEEQGFPEMLKHAIPPARFYSQVPNEIIRHPRLSSDAVRLLTWALSMADEALEALSDTARRAGIGKCAFTRAKRQLVAEGFLHEWRRQNDEGRWSTQQMISNVPLTPAEAASARDGRPSPRFPAAGEPKGRSVGRPLKNTEENNDNPPSPDRPADRGREGKRAPASPAAAGTVPAPLLERGGQALAAVSHAEPRLRLSGREVRALAPLAGDWLQRGATVADIREALTQWLPEQVLSPAGLIRDRLTRKRPAAPTFAKQRAAARSPFEAHDAPRVADMRECAGDHVQPRLFRPVGDETLCGTCRCDEAEAGGGTDAAIEAAHRGGALARELLRARRTKAVA